MDDGASRKNHEDAAAGHTPPPPPEPSAAEKTQPTSEGIDTSPSRRSDQPLRLDSETWDIESISPMAALRMLIGALQDLADTMGDVPPTPPVSRPTTPRMGAENQPRRTSSPTLNGSMSIGSPEAHAHEPTYIEHDTATEDDFLQRTAIARRFFSKTAPSFDVRDYLLRVHRFCPHSSGVYLAAAAYCHRLCVADLLVPATDRTVHRLSLAAIRVAAKALEDNKWTQDRMAGVGGVSKRQLMNLEVSLCFLLDFDLGVDGKSLARRMFLLQQAGRHGLGAQSKLDGGFRLKLPLRRRVNTVA
ncbi:hypothetical protein B0A50_02209 [Salinomyces thailandicus]|uniref:Cyclin-domain-containing protein n=1 Tax=Salinomyces thailandicus TaxID=706561 RepID=A0A4U0U8F0_9PEZI|nr:hypothetical protein B0A50_02209 [Salinomyces thailandica]